MGTAGIGDLGGFLKEVFAGDQVPKIPQGLPCSSAEKGRTAVRVAFSRGSALSPQPAAGRLSDVLYNNTSVQICIAY